MLPADDADGNDEATPGDTLRIRRRHPQPGQQGRPGRHLPQCAASQEVLRTGTPVATTQGTVTSGNDTADRTVVVDVGAVMGEPVEIRYRVTIDPALPPAVRSITNQGVVVTTGGDDVSTDDRTRPPRRIPPSRPSAPTW
ncbi:MAG: hypothetical protein R3A10_00840 [Caldilineaceae bacterium]